MSYQVLARKWRPQTFSELVGQQHVVDAISNALVNDKLHHAYLFTGTRGVGKTTIARIFSKSLNCEQGQSANPCGVCHTCKDISDGRYVDLLEIDAASRTKVEDTRELLDNVQYRPTRGKYKVYLIDEVHMLSKHSFNALLKTLEEPPEHVKFLLATTDPQKLPVTVLSRCLQFSLKALSTEQIQGHLAYILGQEQIQYEQSAIAQLARAAQGSIRDSLSLTDQAIAQGNNQVTLAVVANMLGLLNKNHILKLVKLICERSSKDALAQLDDICSQSPDYFQVLSQVLGVLHQIALTQVVPEVCKLDTDSAKGIYTLAKSVSKEHIQILYQVGVNGKRDLPFAPDARTGLQMTVLRMLAFSPAQSIDLDIDTLIETENDLPKFEALPEPSPVAAISLPDKQHLALTTSALTKLPAEPVIPTSVAAKEEPGAPKSSPEHMSARAANISGSPPDFYDEQPPLSDEEPPMFTDMFADEMDVENSHYAPSQPNVSLPHKSAHAHEAGDTKREESASSNASSTYDLLKVSQQLKAYTKEKEGDEAAKKPEDEAQTALAVESDFAFKLGHVFNVCSGDLPVFLKNGEKLTHAAQVDDYSAFVDATDIQALTRQLLINARCDKLSNPLVLTIASDNHQINEVPLVEKIQESLSILLGEPIEVRVELNDIQDTPFHIQTRINDMRMQHALTLIGSDESIVELTKAFDAKVVEGSVIAR